MRVAAMGLVVIGLAGACAPAAAPCPSTGAATPPAPSGAPLDDRDAVVRVRRASTDGHFESTLTVLADRRVRTTRRNDATVLQRDALVKAWWLERLRAAVDRTQFCTVKPGDAHDARPDEPTLTFHVALPTAACDVTTTERQIGGASASELWGMLRALWTDVDLRVMLAGTASKEIPTTLVDEPPPEPVVLEVRSDQPGRPLEIEQWLTLGAGGRLRSMERDGLEVAQADLPARPDRVASIAKAAVDGGVCAKPPTTRQPGDHWRYRLTLALPGASCRVDLWDDELWFGTGALWDLLKAAMADARYAAIRARLSRPPQPVLEP